MKVTCALIALAFSLTACTRSSDHQHGLSQFKLNDKKAGTPASPSPVSDAKTDANALDKVKYAGAVVFEGGTAKDQKITSDAKTPIFKAIVCIPRTGEKNLGEVDINFKNLGVPNFNKQTSSDPKAGKNAWADLESFTLNYTMSGDIQNPAPGLAYGQVNFVATPANAKWSADPGPKDNASIREIWLSDFKVSLDQNSLMSDSTNYYYAGGQLYYFGTTLYRFTQQLDKLNVITDCENSNQQVIFKKELNK